VGSELGSLIFLVCSLLVYILLQVVSRRWLGRSTQQPIEAPTDPRIARFLPTLLCAFLCTVGGILLIPWAGALPDVGRPGLLVGLPFIAMVAIGAFYALAK
jgi:NADH:ubiquinone oxidoreductase subunit 3 (subunit A)